MTGQPDSGQDNVSTRSTLIIRPRSHLLRGIDRAIPLQSLIGLGLRDRFTLQSISRLGRAGALVRTAILNLDCCAKARVASSSVRQQSEEFRAKPVAAMGHKSVQR
jgi:hypothetical protein